MPVNLYQSDVRDMSDEELRRLSDELQEAHECSSADEDGDWPDSYWDDDAAESRYIEMRQEINRRWAEANPEAAAQVSVFSKFTLSLLKNELRVARAFGTDYECTKPLKVGDTITVRKPYRFTSKDYIG